MSNILKIIQYLYKMILLNTENDSECKATLFHHLHNTHKKAV